VSAGYNSNATGMALRLYRDTTAIAIPATAGSRVLTTTQVAVNVSEMTSSTLLYVDSPATTSATSYSVYFMSMYNTGAAYINRSYNDTDNNTYARGISTITVFEVLA
jgi:hypothetical protein